MNRNVIVLWLDNNAVLVTCGAFRSHIATTALDARTSKHSANVIASINDCSRSSSETEVFGLCAALCLRCDRDSNTPATPSYCPESAEDFNHRGHNYILLTSRYFIVIIPFGGAKCARRVCLHLWVQVPHVL